MNKPVRVFLLFLCLGLFGRAFNQPTTLSAGDIAFIGVNSTDNTVNGTESNDDFVFALLKAVKTGTTIYFTDFGWCNTSSSGAVSEFQAALTCGTNSGSVLDGVVEWKATTDLPYGTRVLIRSKVTPNTTVGSVSGYQANYNNASYYVNISSAESLFAYQGTLASPTLLAGINVASGGWDASLDRCLYTTIPSTLPPALNGGNAAFTLTYAGNVRLKSGVTLTGNSAVDRAIIADKSNWDLSSTALQQPAPGIILPLKLVSFTGTAAGTNNVLSWKVVAETDVDGYSVEGSDDGVTYRTLGFVKAHNVSTGEYSFTTTRTTAATYYRIQVAEKDGRNWFSATVLVRADREQALAITPKPDGVWIQAGISSASATATLLNTAGATVASTIIHNGAGLLPWNNAPVGSYIVVYADRQTKQSFKVAKLP